MKLRVVFAVVLPILLLLLSPVVALRIGVVTFPELGHLNPLMSVIAEASKRGHHTDVFGPDFFIPKCQKEAGELARCVELGKVDTTPYNENFFQQLVELPALQTFPIIQENVLWYNNLTAPWLLRRVREEHTAGRPYDVFLVDFGQWSGVAVADVMKVPVVMVWPLTLQFPVQTNPSVPAIALAMSSSMSALQRFVNYAFQRISLLNGVSRQAAENVVRESIGAPPVDQFDYYFRRWVISPSILGLDVAQPLCPNVVPVGFMQRELDPADALPEEWAAWMEQCGSVIYFNMGSIAVLPDRWAEHFLGAISELTRSGRCVVWKLAKKQLAGMQDRVLTVDSKRVRLSSFLPFSPRRLLAHRNAKVFVTHCGDTSVYESVEAGVPMVGLAMFADQPDMCKRVHDAQIGIALDKFTFTAESLAAAVVAVEASPTAKPRLRQLRQQAFSQGGTMRAVEVIENAVRFNVSDFTCKHVDLSTWQHFDLDVSFILALLLVAPVWIVRRLFCA